MKTAADFSPSSSRCAGSFAASVQAEFKVTLPTVGGVVMAPDSKTLIVSVPSKAQLIHFDTVTEKEIKKEEVEFQPSDLAVQGKKLFVAAKGTPTIHILDLESGKELQEVTLGKEAVESIACHPTRGLVWATDAGLDVYAIDPSSGKVTTTKAKGQKVVVDPSDEKNVYTSIFSPAKSTAIVQELPGRVLKIQMVKGVARCLLLKYTASGTDLKAVAANENAAIGAPTFSVSRDGKLIAMSGPYRAPGKGITQHISVFDTADLTTPKGVLEGDSFPRTISFHPQLDLVTVFRPGSRGELAIHSSKSFAKPESLKVPPRDAFPYMVLFGGRGEKIITCMGQSPEVGPGRDMMLLEIRPLPLTEKQRELLKKNLGE